MNKKKLNILILEDSPNDAELMVRELEKKGFVFEWKRVETKKAYKEALSEKPDIILADYKLPSFNGMAAIKLQQQIAPEIPIILVSGTIGEELAVECLKAGATDYVLKDKLSRLSLVVKRALKEAEEHRERKKAEEALRESEEKLSNIVNDSSIATFVIDNNHKITHWNKACEELTGFSAKEMYGTNNQWKAFYKAERPVIADLIIDKANYDEISRYYKDKYQKSSLIEEALEAEDFFPNIGEKGKWLFFTATPLKDIQGNITGAIETLHDITERKQVEETHLILSLRQTAILDSVPDIIMEVDNNKIYTWANAAGFEYFGDDVIGKEAAYYFEGEQETYTTVEPVFLGSEDIVYVESWQRRKDGKKRLLAWWCRVLKDINGNVTGAISTARDITESKQAESELSVAYDALGSSVNGVILTDLEGNIRYANSAFIKMFEYEDINQVIGKGEAGLFPSEKIQKFSDVEAIIDKAKGETEEFHARRKDGTVFHVEVSSSVVTDKEGNDVGRMASFFDITQRKQAEKDLQESEERMRTMFEDAPLGIALIDSLSGHIYEVNPRFAQIAGRSREEMTTIDWMSITHPDDVQEDLDNMAMLNAGKITGFNMNKRYIQPDGSVVWINMTIAPIKVEDKTKPRHLCMIEDITDRKQSEEALLKSEKKYRNLVENIEEGIVSIDKNEKFIYVNPAATKIFGYSEKELLNKTLKDLTTPDEYKKIIEQTSIRKTGKTSKYELTIISKDGTHAIILVSVSPLLDDKKKYKGAFGIFSDITERKRVEEEIHQAAAYTRSLIEASLDPLVTIGPDGKITDVNKATENVTGKTRKELIGSDFSDYFTEPAKAKEGYKQVFKKGIVRDYPLEIKHKNGSITSVLYNASVYKDGSGKVVGIFAAARDITERKKAEDKIERLSHQNKLILNSINEGIYGVDMHGNTTFINPAVKSITGFGTKELIGHHQHDFLHHMKHDGTPYPSNECPIYLAFKDGLVHHVTDEVFWRKDGTSFPVEYVATPIRERGEIVGSVVVFRDITERKKAEEDLKLALVKATESDRLKTAFLNTMSHELRTPLNAVIGFSEIIDKDTPIDEILDYSKTINYSGNHLLRIVEDIFDIILIKSGEVEIQKEEFNISAFLARVS